MLPEQIAKGGSEHSHQSAFFAAMRAYQAAYPQLAFMYAIPNAGQRNVVAGAKLKAEGMKKGVPDVHLPYPSRGYHGLYIEFKKAKTGKLAPEQIVWADYLKNNGFAYFVCYDYISAVNVVLEYLQ